MKDLQDRFLLHKIAEETHVSIQEVVEFFNVYRKDFYQLFDQAWIKQHNLTNYAAFQHFQGQKILAYIFQHSTNIFGIDLDCHIIEDDQRKLFDRLDRYQWLVEKLGEYPSLVFLSSGKNQGLHCYWKLKEKIFFPILQEAITERLGMSVSQLGRKEIEILPKDTKPLKLPYARKAGGTILDPQSLEPLIRDYEDNNIKQFSEYCLSSRVFDFNELFLYSPNISELFLFQHDKKTQFKNFQKITRLEKYLTQILPEFENGNTNEAIEKMCFNCFVNGLDAGQALSEIEKIFTVKNIQRKHDTSNSALQSRIEAHYKRFEKQKVKYNLHSKFKAERPEGDLYKESILDETINLLQIGTHKGTINRYRKFLSNLYDWKAYINSLDEYHRHLFDYKYKYFYYQTRFKKSTPLPKTLLDSWNKHYDQLMDKLKESGILKLEKKYFNPLMAKEYNKNILGNCNYYRVKFPEINEI